MSRTNLRFVLVGEMHGTVETPAIFGDLVCAAAAGKRPVLVAIEHPPSEQKAIDAFLAATNHEVAVSALQAAADHHPKALVIALVGNLHASKRLIDGFGSYPFMAMRLPQAETVSLFVTDKGGEAWTQMEGECRPHRQRSTGGEERGVVLGAPFPGFDGVLSTGMHSNASPPAIPDAPPPPTCAK